MLAFKKVFKKNFDLIKKKKKKKKRKRVLLTEQSYISFEQVPFLMT